MKEKNSKILIASISTLTTFAGLNYHFDPTHLIFAFIEGPLGRSGVFIFSGILSALTYLALSRIFLKIDFKDSVDNAKKVAIISYILLLIIWSYLYFIFKPA
jgi:hypothetical protein